MIRVLFICHGNICRSPMAEFILKDKVEKRHLTSRFEIASAATSTEEIWNGKGNPIYPPAQAELRRRGIGGTAYTDFSGKRARQVTREDYEHYDYLLCADTANIRNTIRITGADTESDAKIRQEEMYAFFSTNVPATFPSEIEGHDLFSIIVLTT